MAEFALGLTKTALAGTVSLVKSAIEEESKQRERVQEDLVLITGEFQMMQAFLSAPSSKERASKNLVLRAWVRQLRELAFDVEDCVEFIIHLDNKSTWTWLWRVVPSCMVPERPIDQAVTEVKLLKARVEGVSLRNNRYNIIGGDDSLADDAHHQLTSSTHSSEVAAGAFEMLKDVWKAMRKLDDHTTVDLKKMINCQDRELHVVSLWCRGAADVSNDAFPNNHLVMMKKAYDDRDICQQFEDRAWVKLNPHHPFNPVEFINNLLTQFRSHRCHIEEDNDQDNRTKSTITELLRQLRQRRYLVVIEPELTTVADWEAIRMYLPDGNNGSRIVVSTNNLGIALVCTGHPYRVSELKRFSHDRGVYAFYPKASRLVLELKRPGVISILCEDFGEYKQMMEQLYDDGRKNWKALYGVEFEQTWWYGWGPDEFERPEDEVEQFDQAEFSHYLLLESYPEDEPYEVRDKKVEETSSEDKMERCRTFLTRHHWLVCLQFLQSSEDWDLFKEKFLSEPTTGCIVIITRDRSLATHCTDRTLIARDLLKGGSIKEDQDKFELVGRRGQFFQTIYLNSIQVTISVWGIAGVGKSAFVRKKFSESKRCRKDIVYGWVDMPHPFSLTDFCLQLLLSIYSDDVEGKEEAAIAMMEGQDLTEWCCKILHQTKFLLVVDGLRSMHDWDLIKTNLLSNPIDGTTIVTTCEEKIAKHCTKEGRGHVVNIKCLADDEALDLFTKVALDGKQVPPDDIEILNLIISKCGGLPQVITAIGCEYRPGGSLYGARLEYVNDNFMGILQTLPGLNDLFCWMQAYFDACPDKLKPCIFYMSVFHAGQSIRRRRLLRRWIAEGYSSGVGGTAEEEGEKLLSKLLDLSIVYQEEQTYPTRGYKVNGFFREYIKSRPMEDNLVFALEGSGSPSSRLTGQHLTISSSWDRDEVVFSDLDLSRLRSVTVFGDWRPFLISKKMKLLRVIDLEGTSTSDVTTSVTDDDLERILKWLSRIKFLSLRRCVHITRLPDSLGDMKQLETLDARNTSVVELPPAIITKLHKLQCIRAGTSKDTSLLLLQTKTPPPSTKTPTPTPPQEDSHCGTSPLLRAKAAARVVQAASISIALGWKKRARDLVASSRNNYWQFKNRLNLRTRRHVAENGGGVEIAYAAAEGIGELMHLHTLGVVNVAGGNGASLFLKELKKLNKLRKLGLTGINRENWSRLCDAISGNLHHLESFSLQLILLKEDGDSYHFASFDNNNMPEPPKSLKKLKVLYNTTGVRVAHAARIEPDWVNQLPNLQRLFFHELTISSEEDIVQMIPLGAIRNLSDCAFRIKPIKEHLSFVLPDGYSGVNMFSVAQLRIECSSTLLQSTVTFGHLINFYVEAISIHCCCSSSGGTSDGSPSSCNLKIAVQDELECLQEVTVTGTYASDIRENLREQFEDQLREILLK